MLLGSYSMRAELFRLLRYVILFCVVAVAALAGVVCAAGIL